VHRKVKSGERKRLKKLKGQELLRVLPVVRALELALAPPQSLEESGTASGPPVGTEVEALRKGS